MRPLLVLAILACPAWATDHYYYCPPRAYHARYYYHEPVVIAAFQFLPTGAVVPARPGQGGLPGGPPFAPAGLPPAAPAGLLPAAGAPVAAGSVPVILKQHCARCHSGASSKGDVRLFDGGGAFAPSIGKAEILAAVVEGRMPQGVKRDPKLQLAPAEVAALTAWAKQ